MTQSKVSKLSSVIRASEVGQYSFCSIAWQLQRQGYKPDEKRLQKGNAAHRFLGYELESIQHSASRSRWLVKLGAVLIAVALIIIFAQGIL